MKDWLFCACFPPGCSEMHAIPSLTFLFATRALQLDLHRPSSPEGLRCRQGPWGLGKAWGVFSSMHFHPELLVFGWHPSFVLSWWKMGHLAPPVGRWVRLQVLPSPIYNCLVLVTLPKVQILTEPQLLQLA